MAAGLAGCGSSGERSAAPPGDSVATTAAPRPTGKPVATTSGPAPSALDQLASFVAAAHRFEGQLHAAADAMPAPLVQPAILVLSDLVSRRGAMKEFAIQFPPGVDLGDDMQQQRFLEGLRSGTDAAAHFGSDLAALESAARTTPAFTPAAPDSRSAAELAVIARDVELDNFGCDNRGGSRMTSLPTIVWRPTPMLDGSTGDGTLDTLPFSARWSDGAWSVVIEAC